MVSIFHILPWHTVWDSYWSGLGLVSVSIHSGLGDDLVSVYMVLTTILSYTKA